MAEIYLYIVGIVTGMFMILTSYYYSKYSDSVKENKKLIDESKKLNDKLSLRKRYEKKASIISGQGCFKPKECEEAKKIY